MNTLHPDTIEAFHEALAQNPAAMADFYKDNCPGCKMLDASLAKLTAPEFDDVVQPPHESTQAMAGFLGAADGCTAGAEGVDVPPDRMVEDRHRSSC